MKIGFFDSGLGGLTVLKTVRALLPHYDYLYYGDTKNLPYGDKTEEEILTFTRNAATYLFDHGALIVIFACNTASAQALRTLQDTMLVGKYHDRKLLGVIIPTVETLIQEQAQNILLIGTLRTIHSGKYETEMNKITAKVSLASQATPHLVPYIEIGDMDSAHAKVEKIIDEKIGEIDTIVLGCTHYTVLKDFIRGRYPTLRVVSQDEIIPEKLALYLERHPEIQQRLTTNKTIEIILTGEDHPQCEKIKSDYFIV